MARGCRSIANFCFGLIVAARTAAVPMLVTGVTVFYYVLLCIITLQASVHCKVYGL